MWAAVAIHQLSEPVMGDSNQVSKVHRLAAGISLASTRLHGRGAKMTLRIEKVSDARLVILRLNGRLQSEDLGALKAHIEGLTQKVVLDLDQVKLVDREAVCFLAACEASGIQLSQCPPYIREWVNREKTG